jgi:hypothetical protein
MSWTITLHGRRRAVFGALVLAASTLAIGAASTGVADAADPTSHYNVWSDGPEAGGPQAHGYGDVTWISKHRFTVGHVINDICPPDGIGAFLYIGIRFMDGSVEWNLDVAHDTGGCEGDGNFFGNRNFGPYERRVRAVELWACEWNAARSHLDCGAHERRDNPHTG